MFEAKYFLKLANVLETLLQDLLLCDLNTVCTKLQNIGSVSESILLQKVPHLSFVKSFIETLHA